jgi:hypothetical protein
MVREDYIFVILVTTVSFRVLTFLRFSEYIVFATHEIWVFGLELMHCIDIDIFAFHSIERTDLECIIMGIT